MIRRKIKESKFRLCVIRPDGEAVTFMPGSQEEYNIVSSVVERVLARMPYTVHVDEILRKLEKRGVGVFRTQAAVLEAVREEILAANETNKAGSFEEVVEKALHDVFFLVKSEVQPS